MVKKKRFVKKYKWEFMKIKKEPLGISVYLISLGLFVTIGLTTDKPTVVYWLTFIIIHLWYVVYSIKKFPLNRKTYYEEV